ncbi:MAG: DUF488 family protein [Marinifilaceae bacterium]
MNKTIWTIGHSTRTIENFITVLQHYGIEIIADVRSLPGSNKFPQFNMENLKPELSQFGIGYIYFPLLGGLRRTTKDSHNILWRNKSFRGYADYMETNAFKEGVKELELVARGQRVAIMCSEILWWRCHRSMIADYLKCKGWTVIHIRDEEHCEEHPYTGVASIVDGNLSYTVSPPNARQTDKP